MANFRVSNGKIIGLDGNEFIARGVNIRSTELADVLSGAFTGLFPGLNFARINIRRLESPSSLKPAVDYLVSRGIVVELEDHPDGGGGQNNWASRPGDVGWYGPAAAFYKDNPLVWFGTYNEPYAGGLSPWHRATYNAIRGAGATCPILLEVGGSRPANLQQTLDPSTYTTMTNTIWDIHVYGYQNNRSTDPASCRANVTGMAAAAQRLRSADGVMGIIIGEFGDSTDGSNVDANGLQMVDAVLKSGYGYVAWSWVGAGADVLRRGGTLTRYGQMVADAIKSAKPPSPPPLPPSGPVTPSPDPTIVSDEKSSITVANGDKWSLSGAGGQILVNGMADYTTKNVVTLQWTGGKVYQCNTAGNWWVWTQVGNVWSWGSTTAPLGPPQPPPTPPTPPPLPTKEDLQAMLNDLHAKLETLVADVGALT